MTRGRSIYFNGLELPYRPGARFAGAFLLARAGKDKDLPRPEEPPYLFCGNGSCRDCNLHADGLDDVPSCVLPLAAGMSLRGGESAGEENALSRNLRSLELGEGEPLVSHLVIVGAGPAGRAAAAEARALGYDPVVLDARSDVETDVMGCRPVSASSKTLYSWENGRRRVIQAPAVILASGGRNAVVGSRREPQISLAKALGCETVYDPALGYERLALDGSGGTTVSGVFAAGDAARIGNGSEAAESGAGAARAASAFLGKIS